MRLTVLIVTLLAVCGTARASWQDNVALRGYIKETPTLWQQLDPFSGNDTLRFANLVHGRINARWYPASMLTAGVEVKTRLLAGKYANLLLGTADAFSDGATYFDLIWEAVDDDDVVLRGTLDRAWLNACLGSLEITAGRQRIAWGTNLVWNPIDLFNPSSPLDFDNEEKPGTDAVRLLWYPGPTSQIEAAVAPQRDADDAVAAVRAKVNFGGYDWIAVAGRRQGEAVAGAAWAGSILDGGFRGEILWAFPRSDQHDTSPYAVVSISGDYTFRSSLYLHTGVLYNERGTAGNAGGLRLLQAALRNELTPARWSWYGQVARDLSPLVRADVIGIVNPNDHSWFLQPQLTWNVKTDLDLTALALLFGGDALTEFGDAGTIALLRLKYSF